MIIFTRESEAVRVAALQNIELIKSGDARDFRF